VLEQQLEDLQGARLGAVVQCRVALNAAAVHIGVQGEQILGDAEVTLVAGDHQAGVAVTVRHLKVCGIRQTISTYIIKRQN